MQKSIAVIIVIASSLLAHPCLAQESKADNLHARAVDARERGAYDDALELLEKAYLADANARHIHARILVLEQMGEPELGLEVIDGYRDELVASDEVQNLAVLEQRLREQASRASEDTPEGVDALGWTLVGGGGALIAGGITSIVVGEHVAERLRCSEQSSAPKSGCGQVDGYERLSAAQFDERHGEVTLYRAVGGGLTALGAAALGWGLYRVLGAESTPSAAIDAGEQGVRATVGARGRVGVEFILRF